MSDEILCFWLPYTLQKSDAVYGNSPFHHGQAVRSAAREYPEQPRRTTHLLFWCPGADPGCGRSTRERLVSVPCRTVPDNIFQRLPAVPGLSGTCCPDRHWLRSQGAATLGRHRLPPLFSWTLKAAGILFSEEQENIHPAAHPCCSCAPCRFPRS